MCVNLRLQCCKSVAKISARSCKLLVCTKEPVKKDFGGTLVVSRSLKCISDISHLPKGLNETLQRPGERIVRGLRFLTDPRRWQWIPTGCFSSFNHVCCVLHGISLGPKPSYGPLSAGSTDGLGWQIQTSYLRKIIVPHSFLCFYTRRFHVCHIYVYVDPSNR